MKLLPVLVTALAIGAQARQFGRPDRQISSEDAEIIPNTFMVKLQPGK